MTLLKSFGTFHVFGSDFKLYDIFDDNIVYQNRPGLGLICEKNRLLSKCKLSQIKEALSIIIEWRKAGNKFYPNGLVINGEVLPDPFSTFLEALQSDKLANKQMEEARSLIMFWNNYDKIHPEMQNFIETHWAAKPLIWQIKDDTPLNGARDPVTAGEMLGEITAWRQSNKALRKGMLDFLKCYLVANPDGRFQQMAEELLDDFEPPVGLWDDLQQSFYVHKDLNDVDFIVWFQSFNKPGRKIKENAKKSGKMIQSTDREQSQAKFTWTDYYKNETWASKRYRKADFLRGDIGKNISDKNLARALNCLLKNAKGYLDQYINDQ